METIFCERDELGFSNIWSVYSFTVHLLTIVNLTIINARQAKVCNNYKNTKLKLLKTNAALWFNKMCKIKQNRIISTSESATIGYRIRKQEPLPLDIASIKRLSFSTVRNKNLTHNFTNYIYSVHTNVTVCGSIYMTPSTTNWPNTWNPCIKNLIRN
jgi:hypothetical protein